MSLQLAAKHLAAHGRGEDKVLVHMTPKEVKSLNDLAMAHGGQLTINPQTGLPEAGFLSAILPMVAGAALTGLSGGAINPLTAGLIVGGGSYLMNPKQGLMGGLMAGLGAYGGAGLGEALAQQGMQQATTEQLAKTQAGIAEIAPDAAKSGLPAGMTQQQYVDKVLAQTQPYVDARTAAQTAFDTGSISDKLGTVGQGIKSLGTEGGVSNLISNMGGGYKAAGTAASALSPAIAESMKVTPPPAPTPDKDMGQRYTFSPNPSVPQPAPDVPTYDQMLTQQGNFGRQQNYFPNQGYTKVSPEEAKSIYGFAAGGPVELMSNQAAVGANTMYPMANMATSAFATPYQTPQSTNMMSAMAPSGGGTVGMMSGEPNMQGTRLATGGLSDAHYNLGGYSDGGRLLRGPGDGVSDDIPAVIGKKQPARLADGEFVVPARIVSELGNGSTEAGARKLYAMMDRVQAARRHTVGKGKVAKNSRADKYLPA
jgi:hypothetical protein